MNAHKSKVKVNRRNIVKTIKLKVGPVNQNTKSNIEKGRECGTRVKPGSQKLKGRPREIFVQPF